jgi:putative ABC transport system ATP-binding protein
MLLKARNVTKSFQTADGSVPVLRGIDLSVDAGETLALTGESGSGKSTLSHLLGGLDTCDDGTIEVDGRTLSKLDDTGLAQVRRDTVGIIFQQFNLIPSLTVAANIAFQARLAGKADKAELARLSDALGLTEQLTKYPEQLSGGQQQRVAIARALAVRPKLVLADEPTGNLDEDTAEQVLTQMLDLVAQTGAAMIMVTHSPALAARMGRRAHLRLGQLA